MNVRISDAERAVRETTVASPTATPARNLPHSDVANRGSMVPTAVKPFAVEKRPRDEPPERDRKKAKQQVPFGKSRAQGFFGGTQKDSLKQHRCG